VLPVKRFDSSRGKLRNVAREGGVLISNGAVVSLDCLFHEIEAVLDRRLQRLDIVRKDASMPFADRGACGDQSASRAADPIRPGGQA
jgi:hypothetical protein